MNNSAGTRIMKRKKEFVWNWNNGVSSSQMGYLFCCNSSTINIWAHKFGLPRRHLHADNSSHFEDISQDEIARRCEEVQATWDEQTEFNRRVQRPAEFCISRLTWSNDGFIDAGPAESHPMINTEMMNTLMKESGHTRQSHSGFYKESA